MREGKQTGECKPKPCIYLMYEFSIYMADQIALVILYTQSVK